MITSRVREYRSPQMTIQVERRRDRRARRHRLGAPLAARTEAAAGQRPGRAVIVSHEEIRRGW